MSCCRPKGGASATGPLNGTLTDDLFYAFQREYRVLSRTPTVVAAVSTSSPSVQESKPNIMAIGLGAVLGCVILILAAVGIFVFFRRRRSQRVPKHPEQITEQDKMVDDQARNRKTPPAASELPDEAIAEVWSPPAELAATEREPPGDRL